MQCRLARLLKCIFCWQSVARAPQFQRKACIIVAHSFRRISSSARSSGVNEGLCMFQATPENTNTLKITDVYLCANMLVYSIHSMPIRSASFNKCSPQAEHCLALSLARAFYFGLARTNHKHRKVASVRVAQWPARPGG